MLHCKGRITIHDYQPRNYGFSFRHHCKDNVTQSLRGLSFNFTILDQTNKTTCTEIPEMNDRFFECHRFYTQYSMPDMMGFPRKNRVDRLQAIASLFGLTLSSNERLLQVCTRTVMSSYFSRMRSY